MTTYTDNSSPTPRFREASTYSPEVRELRRANAILG